MNSESPFKWRHFLPSIILLCVRWYLQYPLSYRNLEEMMVEKELSVDHTTIYRWVMAYSPEINQRCRKHLRSTNDSWKVDETYIKVNGKSKYLYRAIDSNGQTIDFLLTAKRDAVAAKRFLTKALNHKHSDVVKVINTDKAKAYPKAIEELSESGLLPESVEHRAVKYLNNLIEQDHRFIKLRIITSQNFRNFWSAGRTIAGYESMNMMASHGRVSRPCGIAMLIRKGQIQNVERGDILRCDPAAS
jgi:transposase, IS6 family